MTPIPQDLVEKVAMAMWDARELQFTPRLRVPYSSRQDNSSLTMATAAIQTLIDEGWKPPEKPRLLADIS